MSIDKEKKQKPANYKVKQFAAKLPKHQLECFYCGKPYQSQKNFNLDHVIPKAVGGTNAKKNLVLCCKLCNSLKSDMMPLTFVNKRKALLIVKKVRERQKDIRQKRLKTNKSS